MSLPTGWVTGNTFLCNSKTCRFLCQSKWHMRLCLEMGGLHWTGHPKMAGAGDKATEQISGALGSRTERPGPGAPGLPSTDPHEIASQMPRAIYTSKPQDTVRCPPSHKTAQVPGNVVVSSSPLSQLELPPSGPKTPSVQLRLGIPGPTLCASGL